MSKSVKELIYDYLRDGKEATVARKMHYFGQVQAMFNPIAALASAQLREGGRAERRMINGAPYIVMPPSAIHRRFDDEKLMAIREAVYGMLRQEVNQVLADTGYTRAVETAKGGVGPKGLPVDIAFIRKLEVMHGVHSGRNNVLANIHSDWDGDVLSEKIYHDQQAEEKTMYYTIKPLNTELFHNEIQVLHNLNNGFSGGLLSIMGHSLDCVFGKLLRSMAELGTPSIRLDGSHRFTEMVVDGIFPYAAPEVTVTAPTETNPNVVLTVVVDARRTDVATPCFAVEIGMHEGDAPEENNADLINILRQATAFSNIIVNNIFYGNIPVRNALCGPYIDRVEPFSSRRTRKNTGLCIDDLYATAGHYAETLLSNNVVRQEYLKTLKKAGVDLFDDIWHDTTAFWDEVQGGWVIQPVLLDDLDRRFTVFVTEDELVYSQFPSTYRRAVREENRRKAADVAEAFFGARLENKA